MKPSSQHLSVRERQRTAREHFFQGQSPLQFGLDPAVIRGWQRSLAFGIEPDREVVFQAVHLNRLRASMEASRRMLAAADTELDQLARTLVPSGASVLLTDASLIVVGVRGHRDVMSPEQRISSREGIDLTERQVGSNALSIAAVENAPSLVVNNAHYCTANAIFACAAAPIRAPGGSLLGIIDVTTCHKALPAEAPFLVTAAAKAIENAMFEARPDRLVLHLHPRADLIGTPLVAVISVDVSGDVVGANEAALAMLGLRWPLRSTPFDRLFREPFSALLGQAGRLDRFTTALVTLSGLPVHAQVTMPLRTSPRPVLGSAAPLGSRGRAPEHESVQASVALRMAPDGTLPESTDVATACEPSPADPLARLSGGDPTLLAQWRLAAGALARGVPVVLQGEDGSGKKTLARALHACVPDAGAIEILHCLEASETDFDAAMASAAGGTLVLNEVAAMSGALQARLLRALQLYDSRTAAGAAADLPRFVSVTAQDLRVCCEAGRFRYDLHGRLKGLRIEVPSLHDRADLRERLIDVLAQERLRAGVSGDAAEGLTPDALDALMGHRWRGNFRELSWVMRALVAAAGSRPIAADDLPGEISAGGAARTGSHGRGGSSGRTAELSAGVAVPAEPLRALQDRAILQTLDKHRGNLSSAARELGISRGTLYRRLRSLGIGVEAPAERDA